MAAMWPSRNSRYATKGLSGIRPVIGEPDVVLDFIFESGLLHISLMNIGDGPAYSVFVSFDKELWGVGGTKLVSNTALFHRTSFLAPHKNIMTFLDTSASYFGREQPVEVTATIAFSSRDGKVYRNVVKHDLGIYRDIGYVFVRRPTSRG